MHTIKFDNESFQKRCNGAYGRAEDVLLPVDITEASAAVTVRMKKGEKTGKDAHPDKEQIYVILDGEADLMINSEKRTVNNQTLAFVPRNTQHEIVAVSEKLVYIYFSVWPGGKPEDVSKLDERQGAVTRDAQHSV